MTYNEILGAFKKYMPEGVQDKVIVPIPVEDENPIKTDFVIEDTVTFDNGGSGRYVTATVAPDGLERYDNQTISNATAVLNTGTQTLNMWVTMIVSNGSATMEMDFSEVENPDVLEGISTVVSANLTLNDGGATEAVTFTMTADLVLPEQTPSI